MKLFRDEVMAAQSGSYLGSIRIGRPLSFTLVTGVSAALAAALIAFATWGQVTRKVRVAGVLMPVLGSLQLSSSGAGVLLERRVSEGEIVAAGQTLFVIGVDKSTERGDTAALVTLNLQQSLHSIEIERAAKVSQAREQRLSLTERIRTVESELIQANGEFELTQKRVALAAKSLDRYRQLADQGFVADIQRQQKQEDLIDLQSRAQTTERTRLGLKSDLLALKSELASTTTQLESDMAQLDRSMASLQQEATENEAHRQLVVTAPEPGMVTGLTALPGAQVQAAQTLATLVPQAKTGSPSELEAQLYAPSRTAGFVQAGQAVYLRYAAYPYQKFGMAKGEVSAVSTTPINSSDLPTGQAQALSASAQSNEPLYRINVQLERQAIVTYGNSQPLKPGMALEADVLQDTRTVWEWMLEPLLAASAKAKVFGAPKRPFSSVRWIQTTLEISDFLV